MNAMALMDSIVRICVDNKVSLRDVEVSFRVDDDHDVLLINFAEEDLFDRETNETLETIMLKSIGETSVQDCVDTSTQPKDDLVNKGDEQMNVDIPRIEADPHRVRWITKWGHCAMHVDDDGEMTLSASHLSPVFTQNEWRQFVAAVNETIQQKEK